MKRIFGIIVAMLIAVAAKASVVSPQYPGGEEAMQNYITANLVYPDLAKENGIEGVICVEFIVKADGTLNNIRVKRMVDPDLESEALRLVRDMPLWIPATDDGVKIDAPAEVNVNFYIK